MISWMKNLRCYLLASKQDDESNTSEEEEDDKNEVSKVGKRKRQFSNTLAISSDSSGDENNLPVYDLTGNGVITPNCDLNSISLRPRSHSRSSYDRIGRSGIAEVEL